MTSDVEELLREGIDRLTAGAGIPAGLASRARRRNRQRRIAIRSAAAAGTALVAAAAVIASTSAPPGSRGVPGQDTAYVTSRIEHALAAQANAIGEIYATGRNIVFNLTVLNMSYNTSSNPASLGSAIVPGVFGSNVDAQRMTTWSYRGRRLAEGFSAAGRLLFHSTLTTVTTSAGKQVPENYGAAYPARLRWDTIVKGAPAPPGPMFTCDNAYLGASSLDWRAAIAKALSCGTYHLEGHQRVGGVDAIKLVLKPLQGLPDRETLWVDPSTYLPIRTSVTFLAAHRPGSLLVYDYRWLPPTKANLAALDAAIRLATIPPGFRMLPPADRIDPGATPAGSANG